MKGHTESEADIRNELAALKEENEELERTAAECRLRNKKLEAEVAGWGKIFNAVGSAVWLLDRNHRIVQANRATKEIFGLAPEELIGRFCHEVVHCTSGPLPECPCNFMRETLQRETMELDLGERRLEIVADPILDAEGRLMGIVHIVSDITRRREMVEAMRQKEEMLSSIFRAAPAGIGIVKDRIFQETNDKLSHMTGYSREEIVGRNTRFIYGTDEDCEEVGREIREQIDTKNTATIETRWRTKDGRQIDIILMVTPLDPNEPQGKHTFTALDVTELKRAEEAVRSGEERYRVIAENAKVVIWMMDMEMRYTYVSPSVRRNLGYLPEEFVTLPLRELIPSPSLRLCTEIFEQELEEERNPNRDLFRSRSIEAEHIHRDGRTIPVEINMTYIRDTAGKAVGILGITRDMTAQKQAAEKLYASERRYRQLIDQAADGIFVVSTAGDYLLVNRKFCEMSGYTEEELLKLNVTATYPDEMKDVGEQRVRRVTAGESMRFERPMKRKDGTIFFVELSVSRLEDGRHQGFVHDITERRKTDNELRRLSIAIEQAAEEIMITDPEGVIQYVNPAFEHITGFSRRDAIGQTPRILKSGVHDKTFYEQLWNTIKGGNIWKGRINNKRQDGKLIQEDGIISPLVNSQGELTGYVSLKRDITESVILEAQLRQAQKMEAIGTLAGGIAHDFNNMLGAMMGYVELARYRTADTAIQAYLEQVLTACNRARDLVAQILTFSRQREQEKKPVAVVPIVKEAMKLLRASLPATIEIRQHYEIDNDTTLADPTQIHQVLMNLCTNAVHAMRDHEGVLEIVLSEQIISAGPVVYQQDIHPGHYLKLSVSDTGEGIDPAIQEKIFDPFFTTKKQGEGTGLGLSTVYGIVKDHGGIIELETAPGSGTTFTILLPLIDAVGQGEDRTPEDIPRGSGRILLADDEEPMASLGAEMLASLGYDVSVRLSSRDALEAFRKQPDKFDLVITDMTMPNMTGVAMAREMLKIRPGLPLILTTGFSERINEEEAKRIGFKAFLMKPVSFPILARTVKDVLGEKV